MNKIFICPGHGINGGINDPGAVSAKGLCERDVVKKIAAKLTTLLKKEKRFEIYLFDQKDDWIERIRKADYFLKKESKADVFISIHDNAAVNQKAFGYETYYYPGSSFGKRLAGHIQNFLIREVRGFYAKSHHSLIDRGIKTANFQVLRETNNPAVLVEVGFLSNEYDAHLLTKDEFLDRVAKGICKGIVEYINSISLNKDEEDRKAKIIGMTVGFSDKVKIMSVDVSAGKDKLIVELEIIS